MLRRPRGVIWPIRRRWIPWPAAVAGRQSRAEASWGIHLSRPASRSHRRRSLALACAFATVLAACAGNEDTGGAAAPPSPTPSPRASAEALPPPSATPTPAPSPSDDGVRPANDVDDPVEALREIVAFREHLLRDPAPEQVDLIYAPECECYEELKSLLKDLASEQMRLSGEPATVLDAIVTNRDELVANLTYTIRDGARVAVVDQSGETIREELGGSRRRLRAGLLRERDGAWRVVSVSELSE